MSPRVRLIDRVLQRISTSPTQSTTKHLQRFRECACCHSAWCWCCAGPAALGTTVPRHALLQNDTTKIQENISCRTSELGNVPPPAEMTRGTKQVQTQVALP